MKELKRDWGYLLDPAEEEERWNEWEAGREVRSEEYWNYLWESEHWAKIRAAALERDDHSCQRCGTYASQVHHLRYRRWGEESVSDLISLCGACHAKEHSH